MKLCYRHHIIFSGLPIVQFRSGVKHTLEQEKWVLKGAGNSLMSRKQIPLRLAWAFSIHKSQVTFLNHSLNISSFWFTTNTLVKLNWVTQCLKLSKSFRFFVKFCQNFDIFEKIFIFLQNFFRISQFPQKFF